MSTAVRIEHVAIWTRDPDCPRDFYLNYFGATANDGYYNPRCEFRSFFLTLGGGARIELMQVAQIADATEQVRGGLAHVAFSRGSKEAVDALIGRLRGDGFAVHDRPRTTGNGYYESVVADSDGNRFELTI